MRNDFTFLPCIQTAHPIWLAFHSIQRKSSTGFYYAGDCSPLLRSDARICPFCENIWRTRKSDEDRCSRSCGETPSTMFRAATMPLPLKTVRNADSDPIMMAMQPSICCQNSSQETSRLFSPGRMLPTILTMAMMAITNDSERNTPSPIFCDMFILARWRMMIGNDTTVGADSQPCVLQFHRSSHPRCLL